MGDDRSLLRSGEIRCPICKWTVVHTHPIPNVSVLREHVNKEHPLNSTQGRIDGDLNSVDSTGTIIEDFGIITQPEWEKEYAERLNNEDTRNIGGGKGIVGAGRQDMEGTAVDPESDF
jgi:hypothetical protein